jgi:dTDP-4-amino-4,6-dideoxygalactose transaminase
MVDGFLLYSQSPSTSSRLEIVLPALTFWVVPERQVAGLKPVFADINPDTFNLDPDALERVITPRPELLYPLTSSASCDMEPILSTPGDGLAVIEDCAHSGSDLLRPSSGQFRESFLASNPETSEYLWRRHGICAGLMAGRAGRRLGSS